MESDPVSVVAQEGLAAGEGLEDAGLGLLPEFVFDAAVAGDQTHDPLGDVGVKVVANDAPLLVAFAGVEEGNEVLFGSAFADNAVELAGNNVEGGN